MKSIHLTQVAALVAAFASTAAGQDPAMVRGIGWRSESVFTVGSTVTGFTPVGIPDGLGAFPTTTAGRVLVLMNNELNPGEGYPYALANGIRLTGARVSAFEIERTGGQPVVRAARMAFDRIYDRNGQPVTDPAQVNETGNAIEGLARLCSASGVRGGTFSFVEDIFFTGEETGKPYHPHGGTEWALDIDTGSLWAVPAIGRGDWENACALETGDPQTVALLLGSDSPGSPLYLYIGTKNAIGDQSFLDRNGLAQGQLYFWRADNGDTSPQEWNGYGSTRKGHFQPIAVRAPSMAGQPGYDAAGYLDEDTLRMNAMAAGAFQFSRPEDLAANPADPTQAVFASTGRGQLFPADNWGTVYVVDVDFGVGAPTAELRIVHDADGLPVPDNGIRSPDNVSWSQDGYVYVQEDRSTSPETLFGAVSGADASVWQLDPLSGSYTRIGEVNRTVVLPVGCTDPNSATLGYWETSGILDVTDLFATQSSETLLLGVVQAHGLTGGPIASGNLVESGQVFLLSNRGVDHSLRCRNTMSGVSVDFDVTGGTPGNGYAVVLAAANAGAAPNGWFFGIDVTFGELGILGAPLVGVLDGSGEAAFSFGLQGLTCPVGISLDAVAVELSSGNGVPLRSSPPVTHRF